MACEVCLSGRVRVCDFSDEFKVPMVKKMAADFTFERVRVFFVSHL